MKTTDLANITYDLTVLEAMVDELELYLKSDLLYWQLSPSVPITPPAPMLTLGGYHLRAYRLENQKEALDPAQQKRLAAVQDTFDKMIEKWTVHASQRMERELHARLNSWQWFVEDCQARKKACITYYPTEAELRTLIELLMDQARKLSDVGTYKKRLGELDAQFRPWFKAGDFVWRADLIAVYPESRFWWLYGRPQFPRK